MDRFVLIFDLLPLLLLSGIWGVSAQRQCPRLARPWNGQIVGTCARYIGSECRFDCREPYRLVGSRVRVCRADGTWNGRAASCELSVTTAGCTNCGGCNNCGGDSTCLAIFAPENGYTDGQCSPGVVSQTCNFRCNSGYALEGQSRLTCLSNGQWSGLPPFCRRTSGAICENFVIPNGIADCVIEGGITVCTVRCDGGYSLIGTSVLTCTSSGNWNDQFPICRRGNTESTTICPTLNAPEGGRLVGSCTAANSGDTCQLVCISGYRPTDTRVLVCQSNGQWSSSLPRCIFSATGCSNIQVPNAITTGTCNPGNPGQACTITCNSGYTLSGSSTLICQTNGQWSGSIPTCSSRSCPSLQPPVYGGTSGSCNPGIVGQTCNFYCNTGYNLVGASTLICGNEGRWSGNPPQCSGGECPSIGPPTNGANSGSCVQATVGQSCTFTCNPGYTLSGNSVLICQTGGIWSQVPPQCTRSSSGSCASLTSPSNGYMIGTCAPGRVGETCVFTCNDNYILRGQRTISCESGGWWSANPPHCDRSENEGGYCPTLNPPPNGNFEECDNRQGGRCVLICEPGYLRTGSRVRTCLTQGTWSGFSPTCTRRVGYTYTYKLVPLWSLVFG